MITFGETMSAIEFKELHKADTLQVKENPAKGTKFVVASGKVVAKVSSKYDANKPKEFVFMTDETSGDKFWCLHNPSEVNTIESF